MGQAAAGTGMELQTTAAVSLGGTSIYGGRGEVWRSIAGVFLLALINNGFNILNADPFYRDLTTGLIILVAIGIQRRKPQEMTRCSRSAGTGGTCGFAKRTCGFDRGHDVLSRLESVVSFAHLGVGEWSDPRNRTCAALPRYVFCREGRFS